MSKDFWKYTGPESRPINFVNIKGTHGRVTVERAGESSNRRVIKMDGLTLEISLGLTEELQSAISTSLRPHAGFSIFHHVMMLLDNSISDLMESVDGEGEKLEGLKGRCSALTEALATIRDTRNPDVEYEKARAMERWEARD